MRRERTHAREEHDEAVPWRCTGPLDQVRTAAARQGLAHGQAVERRATQQDVARQQRRLVAERSEQPAGDCTQPDEGDDKEYCSDQRRGSCWGSQTITPAQRSCLGVEDPSSHTSRPHCVRGLRMSARGLRDHRRIHTRMMSRPPSVRTSCDGCNMHITAVDKAPIQSTSPLPAHTHIFFPTHVHTHRDHQGIGRRTPCPP